jgi:MoaA/NifB/PqqE/SkfB family radical SAM enzyme
MDDFSLIKMPSNDSKVYNLSKRFNSPVIVRWDITYKCNYKCLHCYSECSPKMSDGLSLEKVKKLLDIFESEKVQFVQIL